MGCAGVASSPGLGWRRLTWGVGSMKPRARRFWLVLVAQGACVAVGVSMHHHYVLSAAHRAAENEAWSSLETRAGEFRSRADSLSALEPSPAAIDLDRLRRLLGVGYPGVGHLAILDQQGRVVLCEPQEGNTPGLGLPPGHEVAWAVAAESPGEDGGPARGTLDRPDGRHLALAYPLPDRQGYVLVHYPVTQIEALPASLRKSLPVISALTVVWTCALIGMTAYVISVRPGGGNDRQNARKATEAFRRAQSLVRTRDAVIFGMAKLAESRDLETGDHLERISVYSTILASSLRRHPKFRQDVTPAFIRLIGISSALHDIGKVGIPDSILLKPGPLTDAERRVMQTHAVIGGHCLGEIEERLGGSNFLQMARDIVLGHHERWDGAGYPNGVSGTAIPLAARIVGIVDVYDALSSKRVYKAALPHDQCVEIIRNEAGKQFDPDLVEAWLRVADRFGAASQQSAGVVPTVASGGSVELEIAYETEAVGTDQHPEAIVAGP